MWGRVVLVGRCWAGVGRGSGDGKARGPEARWRHAQQHARAPQPPQPPLQYIDNDKALGVVANCGYDSMLIPGTRYHTVLRIGFWWAPGRGGWVGG